MRSCQIFEFSSEIRSEVPKIRKNNFREYVCVCERNISKTKNRRKFSFGTISNINSDVSGKIHQTELRLHWFFFAIFLKRLQWLYLNFVQLSTLFRYINTYHLSIHFSVTFSKEICLQNFKGFMEVVSGSHYIGRQTQNCVCLQLLA